MIPWQDTSCQGGNTNKGQFLSLVAEEYDALPILYLELTMGFRRGELVALLWDALDLTENEIVRGSLKKFNFEKDSMEKFTPL